VTATLDDYATSARIVEILRKVATQEIDKQRPRPTYATVTGVDRAQRTAFVLFPGETDSVGVQMGSIEPSTTGQIARIEGPPGDRYLADVIGTPYLVAPGSDPAYVAATTYDAVGDLLVGGGPDSYLRLPVGPDTYVLTADSTVGGGVKWGIPASVSLTSGPGISVSGTSPNFTISNTGILSIAVNSPLTSTGGQTPTLGFTGTPSFTSVSLADGSLTTPALNFTADANTGLRRITTDQMALVVGGTDGLVVDVTAGVTIPGNFTMSGTTPTIEIGSISAANTPRIDFHSSGNNVDFDARLLGSGGGASAGLGTLRAVAATFETRLSTAFDMQNASSVSIFKFEPQTNNPDGFAGKITFPSGAMDGSAITNGTIPWGKLSAAAQAVIAVTNPDTTFGFLRSATASTADANGNAIGNLGTNGTRVTDGLAYDGVALKGTTGVTVNDTFICFGPYYGYISNTGIADNVYPNQGYGLKPGQYRARVFVRVSSAVSTSAAFAVQVFDANGTNIVENGVDTSFTPAQLGSTSYVAVAVPFTVTATTRTTVNGNGLQVRVKYKTAAGVDVYISHVVVEPYEGPTPNEIITTYIRDAAITSAKINDLQANKITAGTIITDDINLGTGGRVWTGEAGSTKNSGARLVFQGGSSASTRGIFAYDGLGNTTLAVQSDGTVSVVGTITATGGTFTGNVQITTGKLYIGSSPTSGARLVLDSTGIQSWAPPTSNLVTFQYYNTNIGTPAAGNASSYLADVGRAYQGCFYGNMVFNPTANGAYWFQACLSSTVGHRLVAGTYTMSVFAYSEVDTYAQFQVINGTGGGTALSSLTFVKANTWTRLSMTFTFTAGTSNNCTVYYFAAQTAGGAYVANSKIWYSGLQIEPGSTLTPFCYFGTPGSALAAANTTYTNVSYQYYYRPVEAVIGSLGNNVEPQLSGVLYGSTIDTASLINTVWLATYPLQIPGMPADNVRRMVLDLSGAITWRMQGPEGLFAGRWGSNAYVKLRDDTVGLGQSQVLELSTAGARSTSGTAKMEFRSPAVYLNGSNVPTADAGRYQNEVEIWADTLYLNHGSIYTYNSINLTGSFGGNAAYVQLMSAVGGTLLAYLSMNNNGSGAAYSGSVELRGGLFSIIGTNINLSSAQGLSVSGMHVAGDSVGTNESTTSTTYTDLATVGPDVTVVCPGSGQINIAFSAQMLSSSTANAAWVAFEVFNVTLNAVHQAPSDSQALLSLSTGRLTQSNFLCFGGLTPGSSYRFRLKYRHSNGTGTFQNRRIHCWGQI
jgi:hypothetical protein